MKNQKNEFFSGKIRWKIPLSLVAFLLVAGMQILYAEGEKDGSLSGKNDVAFDNAIIQQQRVTIKGVVVDVNGETIIGANVVEEGTTNGISTNPNGEYSLTVAQNASIRVTYIGYVSQVVPVRGTEMNFTLLEDARMLDEVVITGFGLTQRKATLSGAVTTIGQEEISRSSAVTTSGALVGKLAGLNTRQVEGKPGNTTAINIRNYGTPLFIIDGVFADEGQFNQIDFNDIETLTILKDASAAIYGMQSANGVVVVTTKKGQRNSRNTVTISGYYGWQAVSRFPKPANVTTWMTSYIQSETVSNPQRTNYTYSRDDLAKWTQGTEKGYIPFDWYDYVIQATQQTYLKADIQGGSDRTNYYVSIARLDQDYMFNDFGKFDRTNFQMNLNTDITNRLRVGVSMNGRLEHTIHPGVPQVDDTWMPRLAVYRNLPTRRPFANDNPNYPTRTSTEDSTNMGWLTYEYSGMFEQMWRVMQLIGNVEYDLMDGLKFRAQGSYYFAYNRMDNQEYTYKLYDYDPITDTYPVIMHNTNPWRERSTDSVEEITSNVQLSYNNVFGSHHVSIVTGFETYKRENPTIWVHAIPLANAQSYINYAILDTYNDDNLANSRARMGWINRINYAFADKYLVELLGRYDGSWKFPPNDRWGFFPAASLGWRISQESFWQNSKLNDFFSDFKIRGSYGLTGSDSPGNYNAFDYLAGYTYPSGTNGVLDGQYITAARNRGLPTVTISWLKVKTMDLGVDFAFLKNKLTGQADFFRQLRSGVSARRNDVRIPIELGYSLPYENLNSELRMGWEAQLRWRSKINELDYFVGGNITYARRFSWEQYNPMFGNSWDEYRNSSWHRFSGTAWGYEAIGQFQSWEEIASYPIDNDGQGNKTMRPGDIKYKDVNGDNYIGSMDQRPIGYQGGNPTPIVNYGINVGANWRGFDFAFDLTGGWGSSWYAESFMRNPFQEGGVNPQFYMSDTWRLSDIWDAYSQYLPGKYPLPIVGNNNHSNYNRESTFWRKNVRYMKLRNIELGYTLPRQIGQKMGMSSVRIFAKGTNVLTFTNLPGIDPEGSAGHGLDYPGMRVLNIGLNIKF